MKLNVRKQPVLWALIVFVGVESSFMFIEGFGNYFGNFIDHPIQSSTILIAKLSIFILLALLYARFGHKITSK